MVPMLSTTSGPSLMISSILPVVFLPNQPPDPSEAGIRPVCTQLPLGRGYIPPDQKLRRKRIHQRGSGRAGAKTLAIFEGILTCLPAWSLIVTISCDVKPADVFVGPPSEAQAKMLTPNRAITTKARISTVATEKVDHDKAGPVLFPLLISYVTLTCSSGTNRLLSLSVIRCGV